MLKIFVYDDKDICLKIYFIISIRRRNFYKGNVLENDKGIRFAWHVMVMEKNGYCEFELHDVDKDKKWIEYPSDYLCSTQEKQMSFQTDMIHEFGNYLVDKYNQKGIENLKVKANYCVSLNGNPSSCKTLLIN